MIFAVLIVGGISAWARWRWVAAIDMPGRSHVGALPPLADDERALANELRRDVEQLAGAIGERNLRTPSELARAGDWIAGRLSSSGPEVRRLPFEVRGRSVENLELEVPAQPASAVASDIVVVGAHYDSAHGSPGANDNATGVAAVAALAARFAGRRTPRTLRFVAFVNEEPPDFQTETMGSLVYARQCSARGDAIVAMLSLETIGFYSDADHSQHYPFPLDVFYPSRGDFIAFVADDASRSLVRDVVGAFRATSAMPSEGAALPRDEPGVGWSDHWSFWRVGYPAVMVTDTAPFRYPHYHRPSDTPDKIDYERLARVVAGLERAIERIASVRSP
jgi:hypothetical protein